MPPVKKLRLELAGCSLACVRFGRGERPLVMLPGLSPQGVGDAALPLAWAYRAFGRGHRVYVLDKPDPAPKGCTIKDLAADTAQAMKALGLSQADVLGVSQGGMIAQELAIGFPGLVRRLVLAVTASRPNETMERSVQRWIELARRDQWGAFTRDMMERMYSPAYVKRVRWLFPLLSKMGKPRDKERFLALAGACLTCGSWDRLEEIACPVLVLGGEQDQVLTGQASREMAERLACPIYMYEDLGHAAYDEAPDFNRRVVEFFARS